MEPVQQQAWTVTSHGVRHLALDLREPNPP